MLEKRFGDEVEAHAQRGYAKPLKTKRSVVYYEGDEFPFKDHEFDYVICSHVLEHIPPESLMRFVSEIQRVARRGFIEYPTVFYELINYQPVHLWLMNYRDGEMLFLDKRRFTSSFIHLTFREMFYGSDRYMSAAFSRYRELFFSAFEWENNIKYRLVDDFDELVNSQDFARFKLYFEHYRHASIGAPAMLKRVHEGLKRGLALAAYAMKMRRGFFVDSTAIMDKRCDIKVGRRAEIGRGVIIRASKTGPVVIGEYSQINPYTVIYGGHGVYIGKNVLIAPHCVLAAGNHDYKQTDKPMRHAGNLGGPIVIEDDVWLGAHVTVTDSVTIGKGAVVAANAVVTRDVAPNSIVAGVPARPIGNRESFDKDSQIVDDKSCDRVA